MQESCDNIHRIQYYNWNEGKTCTEVDWADINKTHKEEIQITMVHPSLVIGPFIIILVKSCWLNYYQAISDVPIGLQVIDVREVAIGHIKTMFGEGTNGRRFILTKYNNLFFEEIVQILTEEFEKYGYKLPKNTANKE